MAALLFDLDGTLADTAPDLIEALNHVLVAHGLEAKPHDEIRPYVSHGGVAIIQAGFGFGVEHPQFESLKREFLQFYLDNICRLTQPFPGFDQLLETLEQRAIPWGVVTNKPTYLTEPLMAGLGLAERAACIVSGDTTEHAKPHPAPILHACQQLGVSPQQTLYVGDAVRDIEAGRSAGTQTLVALFGYLAAGDKPDEWGADGMVASPLDILSWLDRDAA
ncbi:MAG: HAD-IA family hydrolase [Candidatus Polarisedimenticolaceae bacterium]|nr:HAD-IA family hydrolase [Candidatus Polarisedimenticolaceae bacterium]